MKIVYKHLRADTNEVFYIGMGNKGRAHSMTVFRNHEWVHEYLRYGCIVQIVADNLTESEAWELEKQLIAKYGRRINGTGTLVNIMEGGTHFKSRTELREITRQLGTRIIYRPMNFKDVDIKPKPKLKSELKREQREENQRIREQKRISARRVREQQKLKKQQKQERDDIDEANSIESPASYSMRRLILNHRKQLELKHGEFKYKPKPIR